MAQVNMIAAKRPYKGTPVGGTFTASAKNARVLSAIGRATYADAAVFKDAPAKAHAKAPAKVAPKKAAAKKAPAKAASKESGPTYSTRAMKAK